MGEYREAIRVLRLGIEQDEERQDLHNLLGFCHYKLVDYETAVIHFSRSIEVDPSQAIDFFNLGVNLRKINRLNKAAHNFKIALAMEPYLEMARTNLDKLYAELNQTAEKKSSSTTSCRRDRPKCLLSRKLFSRINCTTRCLQLVGPEGVMSLANWLF